MEHKKQGEISRLHEKFELENERNARKLMENEINELKEKVPKHEEKQHEQDIHLLAIAFQQSKRDSSAQRLPFIWAPAHLGAHLLWRGRDERRLFGRTFIWTWTKWAHIHLGVHSFRRHSGQTI